MFYPLLSFPRGCLDAKALLRLWAAAHMKWPAAVDAWMAGHRGLCVSASPGADVAQGLSSVGDEVCLALRGKTFDSMRDAISAGRMATTMGAQIFFQKWTSSSPSATSGNARSQRRSTCCSAKVSSHSG